MRKTEEFTAKLERVERFLADQELTGIILSRGDNFAWLGCGANNLVDNSKETGVASLVVRAGQVTLVANNIEAERLLTEELDEIDIAHTEVFPWHEPDKRDEVLKRLTADGSFAADDGSVGLPRLPDGFDRLRYVLTGAEVNRYEALGLDCTCAVEATARAVEKGMTEADVASLAAGECRGRGINPVVLLVAADERIRSWRHPLVKATPVARCAMLVACGRRQGLIAAMTRLVHFGEPTEDLKRRHRAVCAVDAAMIAATVPGRRVAEVFAVARAAYAQNGFPDEWRLHHQGGAIGYQPREYVANPDSKETVHAHQAFAWNPSICGTKSEGTILAGEEGAALLTAPSGDWPVIRIEHEGRSIERADILVK